MTFAELMAALEKQDEEEEILRNIDLAEMHGDISPREAAEVRAADYVMCWCQLNKPCHSDEWIKRALE